MTMQEPTLPAGTAVLVTGATGFTGACLVRKLARQGVRIRAIARATSNRQQFQGLPVEWIEGNVFDERAVAEGMRGVEYVFHVAAAYREAKIEDATYHRVHVESTKLLAHEAKKLPNFKRFVHVSTIGVHGHIDEPPANEEYRYAPGDIYQRTKLEGELWLREFASKEGIPWSVIRPAAIYGPGDRRLLKVFKLATMPICPMLGNGKLLYHLIHVDDLCDSFILAATHPRALGQVFIAGNSTPIALPDFVGIVASELGTKPRIVRVPVGPFFVLADICEAICKPLGIEPPLYRRRVAFFTKDRAFDTAKIRDMLGFVAKFGNQEGIRQTARWYVEHGWLKSRHKPSIGEMQRSVPS